MMLSPSNNNNSDTFSIGSLSNSLHNIFPWLLKREKDEEGDDDEDEDESKQYEILSCLNGGDNEVVDLWKLRNFCTTRGGLLSPQIRKQAWPKLIGASDKVLEYSSSSKTNMKKPCKTDVQLLQKDLVKSVWHIEDHVIMARHQEELKRLKTANQKRVTFLPGLEKLPNNVDVSYDSGTFSPATTSSHGTLQTHDTNLSSSSASTSISRQLPKKTTKQEKSVLAGIILQVLRMIPTPHYSGNRDVDDDDRYHYYHGLHELTALLLINLQSPSLTSLVLGRLAERHLRDYMHQKTTTPSSFFLSTLLKRKDTDLYSHIQDLVFLPQSWIQTWWAQQILDVRVASRLLDFFMVSHPSMPV